MLLGDSSRLPAIPFQLATLYYLVSRCSDTDLRTTLEICGWHLAASLPKGVAPYFLTRTR